IDLMLCIFPFEPELYQESGLRAIFVGHPMTSVISSENAAPARSAESSDKAFAQAPPHPSARDDNLIALFPGSREREVKKIFPVMREVAIESDHKNTYLRIADSPSSVPLAE